MKYFAVVEGIVTCTFTGIIVFISLQQLLMTPNYVYGITQNKQYRGIFLGKICIFIYCLSFNVHTISVVMCYFNVDMLCIVMELGSDLIARMATAFIVLFFVKLSLKSQYSSKSMDLKQPPKTLMISLDILCVFYNILNIIAFILMIIKNEYRYFYLSIIGATPALFIVSIVITVTLIDLYKMVNIIKCTFIRTF